ncbi:MAG: hypothetical protein WD249_05515 [Gaiellaceae bacterium]
MILGVSTGLTSFSDPESIGPLYPFPDKVSLLVMTAVGFALWVLWHAVQIRGETRENQEAVELWDRVGLERAMFHGGTALVATDDEWEEAKRTGDTGRRTPPVTPPGAPPA